MTDHIHLVEIISVSVVAHNVVLVVVGCELVHFPDILSLSFVHESEVCENVSFGLFGCEYLNYSVGGLGINGIAVFALDDLLSLGVVES